MRRLPPLAELLTTGGDDRIVPGLLGLNRYGNGSVPTSDEHAFGSSTASTISLSAWGRAEARYRQLQHALTLKSPDRLYAEHCSEVRQRFHATIGWSADEAPDIILTASGTDAHLLAASVLGGTAARPLLTITVEGSETGSGVQLASGLRHFGLQSPSGESQVRGSQISQGTFSEAATIAIRDVRGNLRRDADIEDEFCRLVSPAVKAGRSVLVVATDVSKTGVLSPSLATLDRLKRRWPEQVHVLIDACQFRLSPATLKAYASRGYLMALTGSKFMCGPSFSGFVVIPRTVAELVRNRMLPAALCEYAIQAEWPETWIARRGLRRGSNFGLLLRLQAALDEMEVFHSISDAVVADAAASFRNAVVSKIASDPRLQLLVPSSLARDELGVLQSWDRIPTIFPILLRNHHLVPLTSAATSAVYAALARSTTTRPAIRLGQPVAIGQGLDTSVLRLCFSAKLAVECAAESQALAGVVARAVRALEAIADAASEVRVGSGASLRRRSSLHMSA